MLVRALEACFPEGIRRRKNEEFEFHGEVLPPHLVPVKKGEVVPKEETEPTPTALSQLGEVKAKSFIDTVNKKNSKSGPHT